MKELKILSEILDGAAEITEMNMRSIERSKADGNEFYHHYERTGNSITATVRQLRVDNVVGEMAVMKAEAKQ